MSGRPMMIWVLAAMLLSALVFTQAGCAEKTTGDGDKDDESDDDDDDDETPTSGVGSYSVHLNMVPVTLGSVAEPTARTVFAQGEPSERPTILLSEFLEGIEEFAEDAAGFRYEFIDALETSSGGPVDHERADKFAFYEDNSENTLCFGSTESGDEPGFCGLDNGWIVTHPLDGAFDLRSLAWVNERDAGQPAHLGETIAFRATVHTGARTIVSGADYLKTYVQEDGWGAKIFADAGATVTDQGYDGSLTTGIDTMIGDEVFVLARVTVHGDMIELVPKSGYHVAVLSTGNAVEPPHEIGVADLIADPYRYAGALVRLDDVEIVDIDPEDPATGWPDFGSKSKDIRIRQVEGGAKIGMPVYENTGLPGSDAPAAGFDLIGAAEVDGAAVLVFPRRVEDINPTDERLAGTVRVSVSGEDKFALVDLAQLPAGLQPLGDGGAMVPVVSLAQTAQAAGLLRNPKILEYKPIAYDDRQPFETVTFDFLKSGVFLQGVPEDAEQPDPMVNSYFWDQMGLSEIFYLNGVDQIVGFRIADPVEEGEAVYGEGITVLINDHSYAVPFSSLTVTDYDGHDAIRASVLVPDSVIDMFSMNGSFSTDEIKMLYDYRFVSTDGDQDHVVRLDDLDGGFLILGADPYIVFPDLPGEPRVDKVHVLDMMRFVQVNTGEGEPTVVYFRDCDTEDADVGEGVIESVVYFRTVLEEAGIDTSVDRHLFDYWLVASDAFVSKWTYGHGHFESLYFRPLENKGFTSDPGVGAYGGRASSKAVYEILQVDVPQESPSLPVVIDGDTFWGTDADTCEGCHWKSDEVQIPINCADCHTVP